MLDKFVYVFALCIKLFNELYETIPITSTDMFVVSIVFITCIPTALFFVIFGERWYKFWEFETWLSLLLLLVASVPLLGALYYFRTGELDLCLNSFMVLYVPLLTYAFIDKFYRYFC